MRRPEARIEVPVHTRPIDTTVDQGTRFGELLTRYGNATQFVSSFEGLRSFPSYAEIVRRGPNMLPAIAQALNHGPKQIGLTLAFEDIQAAQAAEGFSDSNVTAGAKTLEEKRGAILGWAEEKSIVEIRTLEDRLSAGLLLFGMLERGITAHMSPDQKAEHIDPPALSLRRGAGIFSSHADLVLASGHEASVLHTFGRDWRGYYNELEVFDHTPGRNTREITVKIHSDATGEIFTDASFSGDKAKSTTLAAQKEVAFAARELFGSTVDLLPRNG